MRESRKPSPIAPMRSEAVGQARPVVPHTCHSCIEIPPTACGRIAILVTIRQNHHFSLFLARDIDTRCYNGEILDTVTST